MIKVKTFFSGWKEITKEQALRWARHIYSGMTTRTSAGKVEKMAAAIPLALAGGLRLPKA